MIERLVIATSNAGKFREFREIVSGFASEIIFAPEIANLIVEETGKNYSQNAMLKAQAWSEKTNLPCLADDSGLEVNALDGAPGLYSARIASGENKISWLLSSLRNESNRTARFAAALALCVPNDYTLIAMGYCVGKISEVPSGSNGFGYDPVFIPDGYDLTFAELPQNIKNSISHRNNAFRKILTLLK